jgi:Na+/phosphate symporter
MSGNNGDNPRLDRIEKILEVITNVQQDMQQEHQMLLRAQIVLGEVVTKLGEKVDKLADAHKVLSEETDERLSALIKIVDDLVRRPGGRI